MLRLLSRCSFLAVLVLAPACSSSSPSSSGAITCMNPPTPGPYSTACVACAACSSEAAAVQSSCASFASCLEACSCSDDTCTSDCSSKLSSQCQMLTTAWGDCDKSKCSSACTQK
jgi:hypothetical protein